MVEPKTKPSNLPVGEFIGAIPQIQQRQDCQRIAEIMAEATKTEPVLWGEAIIGFDRYHMVYASGRVVDWPVIGFSPRKQAITLYLNLHLMEIETMRELLGQLGKHKLGKGCLYIRSLTDVNITILEKLIRESYSEVVKITKAGQAA
jgi:hypothetical protein